MPAEDHAGQLILCRCGDPLDDDEGIGLHESLHGDPACLYRVALEAAAGGLSRRLGPVPWRLPRFRLEPASAEGRATVGEPVAGPPVIDNAAQRP